MKEEIIYEMTSPYRDAFRIRGYLFGSGQETVAIVGPMRGDEVQQQYVSSLLMRELREMEDEGQMIPGRSILVIPTCNPFSMNVGSRFWAMDGTDINRMFPGYDKGETTQRIASKIFSRIQNFQFGIQLASYYVPGDFIPHVRMLKTGYEALEESRNFNLPYVTIRRPLPFDTTLLNYNWQIWSSKAFSIYSGHTETIDEEMATQSRDAILRFLLKTGCVVSKRLTTAYESIFLDEDTLVNVRAHHAGILQRLMKTGAEIHPGDIMARIIHPLTGDVLEEVKAPCNGVIFFSHHKPLVYEKALLYKLHDFSKQVLKV